MKARLKLPWVAFDSVKRVPRLGRSRLTEGMNRLGGQPLDGDAGVSHDRIATAIENEFKVFHRRGVVICAPSKGSGASSVAADLAISLASADANVLLVDANFRDPSLGETFGVSSEIFGFSDYLASGERSLELPIHETELETLSLLPTRPVAENPQELLAGSRFRDAMTTAMRRYDYTVVDAPAGNRSADACRIAGVVGYALVVARQGASFVDDVAILSEELRKGGATVVGCVLNKG